MHNAALRHVITFVDVLSTEGGAVRAEAAHIGSRLHLFFKNYLWQQVAKYIPVVP
jgi:hypothetical protein